MIKKALKKTTKLITGMAVLTIIGSIIGIFTYHKIKKNKEVINIA